VLTNKYLAVCDMFGPRVSSTEPYLRHRHPVGGLAHRRRTLQLSMALRPITQTRIVQYMKTNISLNFDELLYLN